MQSSAIVVYESSRPRSVLGQAGQTRLAAYNQFIYNLQFTAYDVSQQLIVVMFILETRQKLEQN